MYIIYIYNIYNIYNIYIYNIYNIYIINILFIFICTNKHNQNTTRFGNELSNKTLRMFL